ncbi:hypothetical protein QET40_10560 [Akkermansia sp. N21169]|uniref:hypothetical protein n=1 Tax=Akkermansia sp. N21169 TaxID=3040765 RepID=UPI00244ED1F2|nr:hypothetical protein [Akkermansia sp. N21169]MDH3069549.1 hypothetical protein [Akkermansia sp. N21169]
MKTSSELLTSLFVLLNDRAEYAVLRNFEGLPARNPSRDVDIILEPATYKQLKRAMLELVESSGWKIVTYLKSDRLITWVCGGVDSACRAELVQLDFFFDTSVFGIRLLSAAKLLKGRVFNGAIHHVDKESEFLDKYVYDRAVGASYPEKYAAIRAAAESSDRVKATLSELFGVADAKACDKCNGRTLLLRALISNMVRHPFSTPLRFFRFEYYRLLNYIRSNTGFSIGFTGPDGSGKTTVIDLLLKKLGNVFRTAHVYYHFRPALFGNLGEVAHSAGIKKEVDRDYNKPHRGGRTGALSSLARLLYYSLDYVLGYFVKVKSVTRITRLVIFDRYFTDIICDSRRSRIYLPPKYLYWFGKLFIPSLDYNILLTANSDVILARKRELDEDGILSINDRIDYLSYKPGYLKVLNESTPEDAVRTILEHVFAEQHRKNIKRLG